MRIFLLIPLLLFSVLVSYSQFTEGSRSYGMAGGTVAITGKGLMLANPAAEKINEFLFSVGRPTALSGLDRIAFSAHRQFGNHSVETGVQRFGDDLASFGMLYAGIAHRIGTTSLGLRIILDQFRADQTKSLSSFSLSAGGITRLSKSIVFGAYVDRLTIKAVSEKELVLPVKLSAGMAFELSPSLTTVVSVSQNVNGYPLLRSGLEYRVAPSVNLRLGNSFYPLGIFLGTGMQYWNLTADLAASYRQHEGLMVQVTAGYQYGFKKS